MKTYFYLLLFLLFAGSALGEWREWTRNDGKTANLKLIRVANDEGVLEGVFEMRNGREVTLSGDDLIAGDRQLMKDFREEAVEPEAVGDTESVFDELLDGNLEKLEGRRLRRYQAELKPTKYYLFYYTASWCPPCRKFTPSLVDFYEDTNEQRDEYEIILISSDRDEDAMEEYAKDKSMTWPHLKLSKVERFRKKVKHPGGGIPNLVLTDLEGNLLKTSYVDGQYVGPTQVMEYLRDLLEEKDPKG